MNTRSAKLLVLFGLFMVMALLLSACGGSAQEETPTPAPVRPRDTPVPFVPDEALFKEYFSAFGIGQLEEGKKAPDGIIKDKVDFVRDQDICFYGESVKQTKVSFEIFSMDTQSVVSPKTTYLSPFLPGPNGNCQAFDIGLGSFQFRVYIQNIPVAAYDFTVQ